MGEDARSESGGAVTGGREAEGPPASRQRARTAEDLAGRERGGGEEPGPGESERETEARRLDAGGRGREE